MLPRILQREIVKACIPILGNSLIILLSDPILYPIIPSKKNKEKHCKIAVLDFKYNGIILYLLKINPREIMKMYNKILVIIINPPKKNLFIRYYLKNLEKAIKLLKLDKSKSKKGYFFRDIVKRLKVIKIYQNLN